VIADPGSSMVQDKASAYLTKLEPGSIVFVNVASQREDCNGSGVKLQIDKCE